MDINVFLSGLMGSLVGGVMLAVSAVALYTYERKLANKKADQLVGDLKAIYTEKLNNSAGKMYNPPSSSVKMN
jgi:hypothetical protein